MASDKEETLLEVGGVRSDDVQLPEPVLEVTIEMPEADTTEAIVPSEIVVGTQPDPAQDEPQPDPPAKTPNWDRFDEATKMKVLVLVSISTFLQPITTTIYLPSLNTIQAELNSTQQQVAVTLSVFNLVMGVFPLVWGSLADMKGRRNILVGNLAAYTVICMLCGASWNIETLILGRALQGISVSCLSVIGSGSIADVFPPSRRGTAVGLFSTAPLIGPILGPVLGGIVASLYDWRTIFYVMAAVGALLCVIIRFLLPDTIPPENLKPGYPKFWRPLRFLKGQAVFGAAFMFGITFAAFYTMVIMLPSIFSTRFGLTDLQVGLAYLPFGIGSFGGTIVGGRMADYLAKKYGPVARLAPCFAGVALFAVSMVFFGQAAASWGLPPLLLGTAVVGFSTTSVRPGAMSYSLEQHPKEAGGVAACLVCFQFLLSGLITMVTPSMIAYLGAASFYALMSLCVILGALPMAHYAWTKSREPGLPA